MNTADFETGSGFETKRRFKGILRTMDQIISSKTSTSKQLQIVGMSLLLVILFLASQIGELIATFKETLFRKVSFKNVINIKRMKIKKKLTSRIIFMS